MWDLTYAICHRHSFNPFLPSATKLRRLCFYKRLSVHRGGVPDQVHPPVDQVHPPVDQVHPPLGPGTPPLGPGTPPQTRYTPPSGPGTPPSGPGTPPGPGTSPQDTATAADGTHPTGMHSFETEKWRKKCYM